MKFSGEKWVIPILLLPVLLAGTRLFAQEGPPVLWVQGLGGPALEQIQDFVFDADGSAWMMGNFTGVAAFRNQELESAGENDLFFLKLGADMQVLWAEQAGGMHGEIFGRRMAVDGAGNGYVCGYFSGRVALGDTLLEAQGATDAFVVKFNPDGQVLWARRAGAPGVEREQAKNIAVDAQGDVIVAGTFADSADFDHLRLSVKDGANIFLAKYSAGGELQWAQALGGGSAGFDEPLGLALDPSGDIFLTGDFALQGRFGQQRLSAKGGLDGFLIRSGPGGQVRQAVSFGGKGHDWGTAVTVDEQGNPIVLGGFQGKMEVDGVELQSHKGSFDVFVAKFDSRGKCLWARAAGGKNTDTGVAVASDAINNIFITGHFQKEISFGPATFSAVGDRDVFVAAYSASGELVWAHTFGGPGRDEPRALIPRDTLRALLGGVFSGALPLGADTLRSSGGSDIWLALLARPEEWRPPAPPIAEQTPQNPPPDPSGESSGEGARKMASPPVAMAGAEPGAALAAVAREKTPLSSDPTPPAPLEKDTGRPDANRASRSGRRSPPATAPAGAHPSPRLHGIGAENFSSGEDAIKIQIRHPYWGISLDALLDAESENMELHNLKDPSAAAGDSLQNRFRYSVTADSTALRIEIVRESSLEKSETPKFALYRTYRNPFNQQIEIHYEIPGWETVRIELFDPTGVKLRTLVNERQPAGYYRVVWDGKTDDGYPVANGVYEYRMNAGKFSATRKSLFIWR